MSRTQRPTGPWEIGKAITFVAIASLKRNGKTFLQCPRISAYEGLVSMCKASNYSFLLLDGSQPDLQTPETSHRDELTPPAMLYLLNRKRFPVSASGQ